MRSRFLAHLTAAILVGATAPAVLLTTAAPAAAGTPSTLSTPTTFRSNGADLEWTRYLPAAGEAFTGYEVHRSTTTGFTPGPATLLVSIGDMDVTRWQDTTARPGVTFYYRITSNGVASAQVTAALPAAGTARKVLQPTTATGQASYIIKDTTSPTTCYDSYNYGNFATMRIGTSTSGFRHRPVLRFDLRDIPSSATVSSATLRLSYNATTATGAQINVHRLLQPWTEGTGTGQCDGSGVSWLETQRGVRWGVGGGSLDATASASLAAKARTVAGSDTYTVTGLVNSWVKGTPNHGLLLKLADETIPTSGTKWFDYGSDDATTLARPLLTVTYTDGSSSSAPRVSVASPGDGAAVRGTVPLRATAGDDGRVTSVAFLVDGVQVGATDTAPPWETSWVSTSGSHTVTARATDDAGNVTTSGARTFTADNSAAPTVSLTAPAAGATVKGTVTLSATASDDGGVSSVEFFYDDLLIGTDTTAPYSVAWNTLDLLNTAFDGSHVLTARAYDAAGQVTTSAARTVTTANSVGTAHQASFDLNDPGPADDVISIPQAAVANELQRTTTCTGGGGVSTMSSLSLDSAPSDDTVCTTTTAVSSNAFKASVTVTNDSTAAWKGGSDGLQLWYRWYTPDGVVLYEGPASEYFPQTVQPGQSKSIPVTIQPPFLPDGTDMAQVRLRFDLYDVDSTATNKWFAGRGNKPVDNPVIVQRELEGNLGLERHWQYEGENVGAGMSTMTNVANGNMLLRWSPFFAPGRGLATMVDLTYNSLEDHSESPAGNNFSLSISGLSRFGYGLDIHPNKADEITGNARKFVVVTDGDGTTHEFKGTTNADGTTTWTEPPGVNLYLWNPPGAPASRHWALTRPDNVTFHFDTDGFPTAVTDRNGNTLTFVLENTPPGEDPGGPKKRIIRVTDAAGRAFTVDYFSKAEAKKAHVRGKVQRISDHSGSALDFEYYEDGNLRRLIQRGGAKANGDYLADRIFVFTYTTSNGAGPAITDPALRVNPDPKTPNQSTRLFSVRDPRGAETTYAYYGPSDPPLLRWKLKTRTNRAGDVTSFAYNTTSRITTVNAPLSRDTDYAYDTTGKVTSIVNPLEQTIRVAWTTDFKVSQVTEPTTRTTQYTYNHNGYLTSMTDQLGNRTELTYENRHFDARDALGHWSVLKTRTTPRGVASATAGDFQWTFGHDAAGNVTSAAEPNDYSGQPDFVSTYVWNLAGSAHPGTVARTTDPNGGVTSFEYDPSGQPSKITDGINRVSQFGYDVDGQLIWVQDPNHSSYSGGNPRTYRNYFDYDAFHRMGRQSAPKSTRFENGRLIWSSADFDPNDNVTRQVDPHYAGAVDDGEGGPVRTASYDVMDRLTVQADPDKTVDPAGERTSYAWDAASRVSKVTKPKGTRSATVDDFTSVYDYDVLDRVTRQSDFGISATDVRRIHMCYDVAGDLRSVTSPRANVLTVTCPGTGPATAAFTSTYTYDAAHRMTVKVDPLGHQSRRSYDANGNVVQTEKDITTGRVQRRQMTYGERDMPIRIEDLFDGGTGRELTTLVRYDGNRNRLRVVSPRAFDQGGGSADPTAYSAYVKDYQYDKADQLVRTTLPFAPNETARHYVHRSYDGNGNLSWTSLPVTSADPAAVADTARTVMTLWDPGWIRSSDKPADPVISFDYTAQGWQSLRSPEKADQPGAIDFDREMRWLYFDDAQLRERRDRDGNPSRYTYDENDNLLTAFDASGVTGKDDMPMLTEATWDGFDEVTKARHRREGAAAWTFTKYEYDLNGNVTRRLENGKEDLTGLQTAAPRDHRLFYDEADWLTEQRDLGTTSACDGDERILNAFWGTGWERSRELWRGKAGCTADVTTWKKRQLTTWDHFDNGKLKKLVTTAYNDAGTGTVTESHDVTYFEGTRYENGHRTTDTFIRKRGDAGTLCAGPTPCVEDFDYDAREKVVKHQKRAGAVTTYTYDEPDKLIGDTSVRAGNLTTEVDGGTTTTRRYEGNRLRELSTGGATASYVYDDYGNVNCVTLGAGGTSCPNGGTNLVVDYAYDALDRLASQKTYGSPGVATDTADYTYDAIDRVTREVETHEGTDADRTTDFTYQGLTNLVTEEKQTGGSNPKTKTFSYDAYGHRISMQSKDNATGVTENFSYGRDVHGSVSQLLTDSGTVKASYGYSAYGAEDGATTTGDLNDKSPINPYRYMDKRLDSGSATSTKPAVSIDMGARRYGVDTGRFLQQDMFSSALGDLGLALDPLSQNTYALAGGNPVSFVEVDGHMVLADGGGGGTSDPNPTGDSGGDGGDWPSLLPGLRDIVSGAAGVLAEGLKTARDEIADELEDAIEAVAGAVSRIKPRLGRTVNRFADDVEDWVSRHGGTVGKVLDIGGGALDVLGGVLSYQQYKSEGKSTGEAAWRAGSESAVGFAAGAATTAACTGASLGIGTPACVAAGVAVGYGAGKAMEFVNEWWFDKGGQEWAAGVWQDTTEFASDAADTVSNAWEETTGAVSDFAEDAGDVIDDVTPW